MKNSASQTVKFNLSPICFFKYLINVNVAVSTRQRWWDEDVYVVNELSDVSYIYSEAKIFVQPHPQRAHTPEGEKKKSKAAYWENKLQASATRKFNEEKKKKSQDDF